MKFIIYRLDGTRLEQEFEGFPDVESEECLLSDEQMTFDPFIDSILGTRCWEFDFCWKYWWAVKNFNPPKRRKQTQDKRTNTAPLGTDTYIYKAKIMRNLARGTKPHKYDPKNGKAQCRNVFRITVTKCAPCDGHNMNCEHYKAKEDAADTKHLLR